MRKTTRVLEQAINPELEAIDDLLRSWDSRLVASSRRSFSAIRAYAAASTRGPARAKRTAARTAVASERSQVLALRVAVNAIPETATTHNVRIILRTSLTLLAQSLDKRRQAIGAPPKVAKRLSKESEALFLRSLASSAAAGKLLGRGS